MTDFVEKARDIVRANRYMTLATCDGESVWIAPIAYVVDADYNFYWFSATDARHSRHIHRHPNVAVSIYNSTEPADIVSGLQLAGTAQAVEGPELQQIMDFYWQQSFADESARVHWMRPIEDFSGAAILRFYCFTPTRVYLPVLDGRMEVNLEEICRQPPHF